MKNNDIVRFVEDYINGFKKEEMPKLISNLDALDKYRYNTAKRLVIVYDKLKKGLCSKDAFWCALRNYLMVYQTEIMLEREEFDENNTYGFYLSALGKWGAALDVPKDINSKFVSDAFQRNVEILNDHRDKDIFYGTNSYIHKLTGFKEFKSLEQKLAVYGALNTPDGYTTLVSLPTGGGKSLITQALAYQQKGLTIVVVPTVSLALDQERASKINIKHNSSEEIFAYYSGMPISERKKIEESIKKETAKLLFISPEALLKNKEFSKLVVEANDIKYLKNLVIDEAHIVIEWGDFFRVDYQFLEPWRDSLVVKNIQLKTILLSATFTKNTVSNLKQMFTSDNKWIEIRCDALRREPRFILVKANGYRDKSKRLVELVKKLPHPMVIYVNSPDEAEKMKDILREEQLDNLETFTGETKATERKRIIEDWIDDKIDLMIATSAFGVGVDKGDVRTVLHSYIPDTPDQYYQELGRGGRDGLPCLSVMCIDPKKDMDAAYQRKNKVMLEKNIWGRWISMLESPTTNWFHGKMILDTAVKPIYNVIDGNDKASSKDIQWNIYVILLLRRYNLIDIKDMIYEPGNESYKIRIDIIDDRLRGDMNDYPDIIKEIRAKEVNKFESGIQRIRKSIEFSERVCWSEMFYTTYDKVSAYCSGCNSHESIERMEYNKFPLLTAVKEPSKSKLLELNKICQAEHEIILIGQEDDYTLINQLLDKGISIIVTDNSNIVENMDLILNMNNRSNIMIISIKEYKELRKLRANYFVGGEILCIHSENSRCKYENYTILSRYKDSKGTLIHLMKEDFFIGEIQKPISSLIEGPKIESYLLERM